MTNVHVDLADEVDFTIIRYSQCWEDADVVLEALDVQPGDVCLSIASAGDNTLSLLCKAPSRVVAIDLSASQLACLELRVAAYRHLTHDEMLELMGARPSQRRQELYQRLASELTPVSRRVWDAQGRAINLGIGRVGKFEQYLDLIRRFAVNPTHSRRERVELFSPKSPQDRKRFYDYHWNNWRWRALVKIACSRFVMGRLGRDPRFFKYAEGSVSDHIMQMAEHALVELDPSENPYLHWIVQSGYGDVLPHALRSENYELIRANLNRLEWQLADVQSYLDGAAQGSIHRFNFSDVFEYLSEDQSRRVFEEVVRVGCPGGRLAYWNMLVSRHRPTELGQNIRALEALSARLHKAAGTFFYTGFIAEEIV